MELNYLGDEEEEYGHHISGEYIYESYTNTLNLIKEKTDFVDEEPKLENIECLNLSIGNSSFWIEDKDDIQYILERSKPREKEIHSNDSIWFEVYYNDERQITKRVVLEEYEKDIIKNVADLEDYKEHFPENFR